MLSVTDHGLGLKMSQTNLLKAGQSAEPEVMRVKLGTTKDLQPIQTRQKAEQVKAYCPTTQARKPRHKGMPTGTGKVLDGSSREVNTASIAADRAQANRGVGKVLTTILAP